jgi:hypothetical protein
MVASSIPHQSVHTSLPGVAYLTYREKGEVISRAFVRSQSIASTKPPWVVMVVNLGPVIALPLTAAHFCLSRAKNTIMVDEHMVPIAAINNKFALRLFKLRNNINLGKRCSTADHDV